jgi:hypothetical protein
MHDLAARSPESGNPGFLNDPKANIESDLQ